MGIREFRMRRLYDASGVSGIGIVAEGCEFSDGTCAIRWLTERRSTAFYDNVNDLISIHSHNGATVVEFADELVVTSEGNTCKKLCGTCLFLDRQGDVDPCRNCTKELSNWVSENNYEIKNCGYRSCILCKHVEAPMEDRPCKMCLSTEDKRAGVYHPFWKEKNHILVR